jgi:hypothetical protein
MLSAAAFVVACGDTGNDTTGNDDTTTAAAGTISGKVTDTSGKPLANAEMRIVGDTLAGQEASVFPRTGADGTYSVQVADGNYGITGEYTTTFNGKDFKFQLHPKDGLDGATFPSAPGVARDFEWRLKGPRPGTAAQATEGFHFYGGEVVNTVVDLGNDCTICDTFSKETPNGFTAEVTFTPQGALADGTAGAPITSTYEVKSKTARFWSQVDIPLGRYTVTARILKPGADPRPAQITKTSFAEDTSDDAPKNEATLDFIPGDGATGGIRRMGVHLLYGAPYPAPGK